MAPSSSLKRALIEKELLRRPTIGTYEEVAERNGNGLFNTGAGSFKTPLPPPTCWLERFTLFLFPSFLIKYWHMKENIMKSTEWIIIADKWSSLEESSRWPWFWLVGQFRFPYNKSLQVQKYKMRSAAALRYFVSTVGQKWLKMKLLQTSKKKRSYPRLWGGSLLALLVQF